MSLVALAILICLVASSSPSLNDTELLAVSLAQVKRLSSVTLREEYSPITFVFLSFLDPAPLKTAVPFL